eukprot:CAMPEP_0170573732 /NCGR_PEP_ID=MMETSP0224-20130122/2919_1 /TAXON_ID=285029 /ORGANISM="Togula jolla, Strain CCCM 725" /LENGTH=691 /DNA_ID=CAMNT_0010896333 /DNA_START=12 /DNA_END=2088 /DNA_ORIENTATION=-
MSDSQMPHVKGLQYGYSQEQWGPWRSHGLLLQQAIAELGWQESAATLIKLFTEQSRTKERFLNREEFVSIMQKCPCCHAAYHHVFFELFDRDQDGYLSESDFLGGMLAVSPLTPHKLDAPSGQLRMQFIFLYYDANRNGQLEIEEVAKMIEHIQQLRGKPYSDAMVDATALVSLYSGPFGFAAFYDAAQKRMLNGTSPLLRTQQDLAEAARKLHSIAAAPTPPQASCSPSSGQAAARKCSAVPTGPLSLPEEQPRKEKPPPTGAKPPPTGLPTPVPRGRSPAHVAPAPASHSALHVAPEYWGSGSGQRGTPVDPHVQSGTNAQVLALRVVRKLMELSNGVRAEWRHMIQLVSAKELLLLCDTVVEILRVEDSLVEVALPCRVYGDIHGQLLDLLEFFNAFSWPDKRRGDIFSMNYVFLGDFVDRGAYSCDVVSLLFSLKILYPSKVFLVRGNHEDRLMNMNYGFQADCLRKFAHEGEDVWERVNDVFEFLPIAALVEGAILCIHGGIGDSIASLEDLRGIPKPIQVIGEITESTTRRERMILDALWSDPTENDSVLGVHASPRGKNTCRFGPDRVQEFNRRNGLRLIIRAHECVQHGYEYFAGGQLLTVFSATNYCNQYNNDGAMVVLVKDERTGEAVEHAQVIKSGTVDTSNGWNDQQFRAPSPMGDAERALVTSAGREQPRGSDLDADR